MGDRGQTATGNRRSQARLYYSRWEIGGKPQLTGAALALYKIIADGRSGANRNPAGEFSAKRMIIADGRSGANRNPSCRRVWRGEIIADGRSGANRNRRWGLPESLLNYSRWEIGGKPQLQGMGDARELNYSRWEIGGKPQRGSLSMTR